jgi:hypothetical protein
MVTPRNSRVSRRLNFKCDIDIVQVIGKRGPAADLLSRHLADAKAKP